MTQKTHLQVAELSAMLHHNVSRSSERMNVKDVQSRYDRPQNRPHENTSREQTNRKPSRLRVPNIRNDAARVRQRCTREEAGDEARNKESLDILREGLAEVENCVQDHGDNEYLPPADKLTSRAPYQRLREYLG